MIKKTLSILALGAGVFVSGLIIQCVSDKALIASLLDGGWRDMGLMDGIGSGAEAGPPDAQSPQKEDCQCTCQADVHVKQIQFVGVTQKEADTDSGLGTLNQACAKEYPGSKMCTDVQIMNSFPAPYTPSPVAILNTVASANNSGSANKIYTPFMVGEVYSMSDFPNCYNEYTSTHDRHGPFHNSLGMTVYLRGRGELVVGKCGSPKRVACCALK